MVPTSKFEVRPKRKKKEEHPYWISIERIVSLQTKHIRVRFGGWCYENTALLSVRVGKEVQTLEGEGG